MSSSEKKCSKCGEVKNLSMFYNKFNYCKTCSNEKNRLWVLNNKEKNRAFKKKYRENNYKKALLRQKEYRDTHKEEIKEYRDTHKEEIKELQKQYYKKNRYKLIKKSQKYYEENTKEKIEYAKDYYLKYKNRISERQKKYRYTHKDKKSKTDKIYRENNKEILAIKSKVWRENNKADIVKRKKEYTRLQIDELKSPYVASLIGVPISDCPSELLELKRAQIQLKRALRE